MKKKKKKMMMMKMKMTSHCRFRCRLTFSDAFWRFHLCLLAFYSADTE